MPEIMFFFLNTEFIFFLNWKKKIAEAFLLFFVLLLREDIYNLVLALIIHFGYYKGGVKISGAIY